MNIKVMKVQKQVLHHCLDQAIVRHPINMPIGQIIDYQRHLNNL